MDQGVIRRKLAGAQMPAAITGGAEKAWPLALARSARDDFSMTFEVSQILAQRLSLTELLELPPERAMIALLEGPREGLGILLLSPEVLAALIEAQTLGKVSNQPVMPRKPTRTDAAMVADFFDHALIALQDQLLTDEDLVWTDGFRYSSFLDEPRPLALLLEDTTYKVLQAECLLGGMRQGKVILALPADGHGRRPHRHAKQVAEPAIEMVFSAALGEQILESACELQAVLSRVTVPLATIMGLTVGAVIPLPTAALDRITLEGIDSQVVGQGRLGQNRGQRAVRMAGEALAEPPSPQRQGGGATPGVDAALANGAKPLDQTAKDLAFPPLLTGT